MSIKISIIMPCYNAGTTIGEQLQAISEQSWDGTWELIVVDNRSTDNSIEIVEAYKNQIKDLRVVKALQKQSASYAVNEGVKKSKYEYLLFCDADDLVAADWLEHMANAFKKHDFIACRWELKKLNKRKTVSSRGKGQSQGLMEFSIVKYLPHAGGGAIGVRKSIHHAVGGFDEDIRYLSDTDYCWKIQLQGTALQFVPDAVIHIRYRDDYWSSFKQLMLWEEDNIFLYKKYREHGMPEYTKNMMKKSCYKFLKKSKYLFSYDLRRKYLNEIGKVIGRVRGSIRYKVFIL
jgi:glycosyltransferase involved in cell wall biosynthesis